MATFLIKSDKKIIRQQGDDFDIVFIVPEIFPLTNAEIKFWVFGNDSTSLRIIEKNTDSMVIDNQRIKISVSSSETLNKSGLFRWELEVTISGKITTIGRGQFEITKTYIR